MFVLRARLASVTDTKTSAEVLVEAHMYCCLDGRCDTPAWATYERDSVSLSDAPNWAERQRATERLLSRLTAGLFLTEEQVAIAAHSTSRSDSILAEAAEQLHPGAMI